MSPFDPEKIDLEEELRTGRPRAPRRFLAALAATAGPARSGFRGRRPVTVALVGVASLAVMGGIGFAASSAVESSKVSVKRVADAGARSIAVRNAAKDQYSKADQVIVKDNKPPEVTVATPAGNKPLPAVQPTNRPDVTLTTTMTVKESGTLSVSVFSADRKKSNKPLQLLINGFASFVDGDALGSKQSKSFTYRITKPRTLTIEVSIPGSQLVAGEDLSLRLAFTDWSSAFTSQRKTVVDVPAVAPATITKPTPATGTASVTVTLTDNQIQRIQELLAEPKIKGVKIVLQTFPRSSGDIKTTVAWQGGKAASVVVYRSPKAKQVGVSTLDRTAVITTTGGAQPSGAFQIAAG